MIRVGQFKFSPPQVVVRFHCRVSHGCGAGSRLTSRKLCSYDHGANHSHKDTDIHVVVATKSPPSKEVSAED